MDKIDNNKVNTIQTDLTHTNSCSANTQSPGTPTTRKRPNPESDMFDTSENKKLKSVDSGNGLNMQIPKMGESELFLFSAIQNLATNITLSFNMLNEKMSQLESNLEEKISTKIQAALETKVKAEVDMLKQDIRGDMEVMNAKIDTVQKTYDTMMKTKEAEKTPPNSTNAKNKLVIKNLDFDAQEEENNQVTINKVQSLFKDGLGIPDVKIKSAERKMGKGNSCGIILVEIDNDSDQKKNIFSNKRQLKNTNTYKNVYINNDLPIETRIHQSNMRTLLKEVGKEREMFFIGNKLVHRRH